MKFFLLSDNIDTLMGLRLVGIEGKVVHTRKHFLETLQEKMKDESIAIILVTTKLIEMCPDIISEIPDRHGNSKIGETIDGYVSEAIGVKL